MFMHVAVVRAQVFTRRVRCAVSRPIICFPPATQHIKHEPIESTSI